LAINLRKKYVIRYPQGAKSNKISNLQVGIHIANSPTEYENHASEEKQKEKGKHENDRVRNLRLSAQPKAYLPAGLACLYLTQLETP